MSTCRRRVCEAGETARDAAVEGARGMTARLAASLLGGLPLIARRTRAANMAVYDDRRRIADWLAGGTARLARPRQCRIHC